MYTIIDDRRVLIFYFRNHMPNHTKFKLKASSIDRMQSSSSNNFDGKRKLYFISFNSPRGVLFDISVLVIDESNTVKNEISC